MTRLSYLQVALRSVRFYWRTELSVFLGTVVAVAALVGGLLVGDSVRYSLRQFALMRLGDTQVAMNARDRFYAVGLADRMQAEMGAVVAPALVLRGVVLVDQDDGRGTQVNHVQVLGVDSRFWRLAAGVGYEIDDQGVGVNSKLAARLGVGTGAEISVRVEVPGLMPRDAPLSSRKESLSRRGRFVLRHIVPDAHLGRFSLAADQVAPHNVFVDLHWLQETVELERRANVMLVGSSGGRSASDRAADVFARVWTIEDAGVGLHRLRDTVQLQSDRIFLDPAVSHAALSIGAGLGVDGIGVLTYLVNEIRKGARATPYSFAVAAAPSAGIGPVPSGMTDDQAIINQWLADQLEAKEGDTISVAYYELTASGEFIERERNFTVLSVARMVELETERELMPVFPGLTDVDQCREWDVGMPLDEEALQDSANQQYWDAYRATPKLIVTLAAGRAMWANRFGDTSAVRYPVSAGQNEIRQALNDAIDPGALGMFMVPVRAQALKAVDEGMDLGELFVSMSFFLILSALVLTGMLFIFGIQQRATEMGLLLSVGHRPRQVRCLYLMEGATIALLGSVVGSLLGMGYTRALVWGLGRYWDSAVAGAAIQYHAEPATMVRGAVIGLVCALVAMALAMWRQSRRPPRELLAGEWTRNRRAGATSVARWPTAVLSLVAAGAAVGAVRFGLAGGDERIVYIFFGAGSMILLAGLGFSRLFLQLMEAGAAGRISLWKLGARNASRRGGRSLASVTLLACGCFIVIGVSAMQQDLSAFAHERWSGTGGFALFGESTLSIPDALESEKGRDRFGLAREPALADASIISLKVRDGDDASCFNLNRAQAPRLLGVDPVAFSDRKAFAGKGRAGEDPWSLLEMELPEGVIPGLAGDANTAMWNLRKKAGPQMGDEIVYRDERGEMFRVKLVGTLPMPLSIFQGTVLIAKQDFMQRYPSEAGYRMFVVDLARGADAVAVQDALSRRLDRAGLDIVSTLTRLEEFHSVEATYLGMFLLLGGLGVVLGTFGLGTVLSRNVLERRSELAILRCLGYTRSRVLWLVLAEHWMLLAMGVVCGAAAAFVAIYPALTAPGVHTPLSMIVVLLGGILLAGVGSTVLAVKLSLRGDLVPALRNE